MSDDDLTYQDAAKLLQQVRQTLLCQVEGGALTCESALHASASLEHLNLAVSSMLLAAAVQSAGR